MKIVYLVLSSMIIFCSCTSSVKVLKPEGENVSITLASYVYEGELLEINDSTFFFLHREELCKVPIHDILNVYVHGFSLQDAKLWPTITLAILDVLAFGAASESGLLEEDPLFAPLVLGTPLLLLSFAYFTGDPKVSFSPPLDENYIEKLKSYCRYPQGLNQEQRKMLLKHYNQENFQLFIEVLNE